MKPTQHIQLTPRADIDVESAFPQRGHGSLPRNCRVFAFIGFALSPTLLADERIFTFVPSPVSITMASGQCAIGAGHAGDPGDAEALVPIPMKWKVPLLSADTGDANWHGHRNFQTISNNL